MCERRPQNRVSVETLKCYRSQHVALQLVKQVLEDVNEAMGRRLGGVT